MAQEQQTQNTVRVPLYAHEAQRPYGVASLDAARSKYHEDQHLVNCYPVVTRDPLRGDAGRVFVQGRFGWQDVDSNVDLARDDTDAVPPYTPVLSNLSSAYVKGVINMTALKDILVVCYVDGTNFKFVQYRPITATCRLLGTVAMGANFSATSFVTMTELAIGAANTPYLGVVISDHGTNVSEAYYCSSTAGVMTAAGLTQITDADFPTELGTPKLIVGGLVQLNENIYVMTQDGYIYNSELDGTGDAQIVNWNSQGYVNAQSYADRGLGLVRYKHHLVAFGQETMEFFNDEGNPAPDSPLAPTQQAFINIGTLNQKSYINVEDTIWWVSASESGDVALYKLEGYTPVKVSSYTQSRILSDRAYYIEPQVTTMHGMKHIIMNLTVHAQRWFDDGVNNGDTVYVSGLNQDMRGNLCYCIDSNAWWIWLSEHEYGSGQGTGVERYYTATLYNFDTVLRINFSDCADAIAGFTYGLHPRIAYPYYETASEYWDAYNLDNSTTVDSWRIPVLISTNPMDFGNDNRKFLRSVRLIADRIKDITSVSAPVSAFNTDGLTLNMGFTRTDGFLDTDTPEIKKSKALRTQTEHRYNFNNFGAFRKGRFIVSINSYVPVRFEALEVTLAQGTH